ncbi:hypothetical protein [Shewanella nanhaiensis]|uniref:Uncharacterized protein n=1 Tax=Shewanella nanhaiensis TaxID=2864872 RepID=A0ABS7E324_9GAMM|nr:hypothetical protein [Shewanella nanhaiensis]MBW8184050.1 hypothetical protein [Shewanella nanhaiensis]
MAKINGVDIGNVVKEALDAAKGVSVGNWSEVKDIVKNIGDSMLVDLKYVAKKKLSGDFDEYDAKIFMEDQKMVARVRLRSLAIITLKTAEDIINAVIDIFRAAGNKALGWEIF